MHLAHNGDGPRRGDQRRVLIVGSRTLYLQALCELLDCTAGLSASLVSPACLSGSALVPAPDVVLLDCDAIRDELEQLRARLGQIHKDARIVLITSGTMRESSKQAATLHASGWVSLSLPAAELVAVIHDREPRARDAQPPASRRSRSLRSAPADLSPLSSLSEREMLVLRLVVERRSADEIAALLGISRHTVRTHLQNIMAKLLVRSRTEMVSVARSLGVRPAPTEPPS